MINLGDADFRGELARARAWRPDAFYIQTSGSIAEGAVLRQARELGLNQQFFISSNLFTVRSYRLAMGPYTEGAIFGGPNLDRSTELTRNFIRAFRTKMGFEPGYAHGLMFDAPRILCYGLNKADGGPPVRDAIAKMTGLPTVLGGQLAMGADHYTSIPAIGVWLIKHGAGSRLVSPAGFRSRDDLRGLAHAIQTRRSRRSRSRWPRSPWAPRVNLPSHCGASASGRSAGVANTS